jgi:hypothetical protein
MGLRTVSVRGRFYNPGELPQEQQRAFDALRGADEDWDAGRLYLLDVLPAVLLLDGDDEVGFELQEASYVHLLRAPTTGTFPTARGGQRQ